MLPGAMKCRLCGGETAALFERTVLAKYPVRYHQCLSCGLTQTDEPTWLEEAYGEAIHSTDTGVLARNLGARRVAATFLHLSGVRGEPCVDYAGGYGIFTRLMRDVGFEFFWMDPYATNMVARGFEWRPGPAFRDVAAELLAGDVVGALRLLGREHAADRVRFLDAGAELPRAHAQRRRGEPAHPEERRSPAQAGFTQRGTPAS